MKKFVFCLEQQHEIDIARFFLKITQTNTGRNMKYENLLCRKILTAVKFSKHNSNLFIFLQF